MSLPEAMSPARDNVRHPASAAPKKMVHPAENKKGVIRLNLDVHDLADYQSAYPNEGHGPVEHHVTDRIVEENG